MKVSRRTGLIGKKLGMTQAFNANGEAISVTLVDIKGNVVVEQMTQEKNGYNALLLGFSDVKERSLNKPQKGLFAKQKIALKRHLKEFRISDNAFVPVGAEIAINHFIPEQSVDIQSLSTGKGFAGVMKRHNFRGLEASHGVSVSHRSHGSTGQRQDPGRVFKGKKMAGHLGQETTTIQNVHVFEVDAELGIIALHGSVPGKRGTIVYINDSVKMALPLEAKFPAAIIETDKLKAEHAAPIAEVTPAPEAIETPEAKVE